MRRHRPDSEAPGLAQRADSASASTSDALAGCPELDDLTDQGVSPFRLWPVYRPPDQGARKPLSGMRFAYRPGVERLFSFGPGDRSSS
jgi:hypothetical protein